jgi:hypothetical protein
MARQRFDLDLRALPANPGALNSLGAARVLPEVTPAELKATRTRLHIAILAKPPVPYLDRAGRSAFLAHVLRYRLDQWLRSRSRILRRDIHFRQSHRWTSLQSRDSFRAQ